MSWLFYQLECLLYDIRRLCALVFYFFNFFLNFLFPFESWSNPMFDQDLNMFKTWKWKGKPRSFLVTPKWSFLEGFWNFHVWNPKPLLFVLDFIRQSLALGGRYMIFLFWICPDLVYQLECLLYDIRRLCALVFRFFYFFWILMPIWILVKS